MTLSIHFSPKPVAENMFHAPSFAIWNQPLLTKCEPDHMLNCFIQNKL